MKNPFLGHIGDNVDMVPPKTDYVKTIHKGKIYRKLNCERLKLTRSYWSVVDNVQPAPIPLDVALIVVASIVSLGLTSVAVVMILHMRSKLLETARLSIYEEAKAKNQESATRISSIVMAALPREYNSVPSLTWIASYLVKHLQLWPRCELLTKD